MSLESMHSSQLRYCSSTLVLVLSLAGAKVQARTTTTVCPVGCDYVSIQLAINAASPGDTIQIPITGEHTEAGIVIDKSLTIEGAGQDSTTVQASFIKGSATDRVFNVPVVPSGQEPYLIAIRDLAIRYGRGDSGGCVEILDRPTEVFFNNVTLHDCEATNGNGGAISSDANLFMENTIVRDNLALHRGGGIFNDGVLDLNDSIVEGNSSGGVGTGVGQGGGIYNAIQLWGRNSIVSNNLVHGGIDDAQGGGIFSAGFMFLSGLIIINNAVVLDNPGPSNGGGGIYALDESLSIWNSEIAGNQIRSPGGAFQAFGGGLFIDTFVSGTASIHGSKISGNRADVGAVGRGGGIYTRAESGVDIRHSEIVDNQAVSGGGIYTEETSGDLEVQDSLLALNRTFGDVAGGARICGNFAQFINSTISSNESTSSGGGLYVCATSLVFLANTTVTNNTADSLHLDDGDGGGIYQDGGTVTILNSIISGNFDGTQILESNGPDCYGSVSSAGYNLIGDLGYNNAIDRDPVCEITGTSTGNQIEVEETLGPLSDNGGPTQTHSLLPQSHGVDAGNPNGFWDLHFNPIDVDQRGWARQNPCDRGAFELGALQPASIFAHGFEGSTFPWSDEYPGSPRTIFPQP